MNLIVNYIRKLALVEAMVTMVICCVCVCQAFGIAAAHRPNSEHYHCFLSFLYSEHVSVEVRRAWDELSGIMQDGSQKQRSEQTMKVPEERFYCTA